MWRSASASADLIDYREGYPSKVDNPKATRNVSFYRNECVGPEGLRVDEVFEIHATDYRWLERCHEFIQWLFPIQERGMNPDAQVLMRHEIATMRTDPVILKRIWRHFEMMLGFYGMRVEVHPQAMLENYQSTHASIVPWQDRRDCRLSQTKSSTTSQPFDDRARQKMTSDEGVEESVATTSSSPGCPVQRFVFSRDDAQNPAMQKKLYQNLCVSSHNYLRITRILKFLGEMGMEDVKIGWLVFLAKEAVSGSRPLKPCTSSLVNYWSGTIYNDDEREDFLTWMRSIAEVRRSSPEKEKKRDRGNTES